MKEIKDVLITFGLTKHETEVYLELVNSGPSLVSGISRKTGLHRPTIYKTLPRLQAKELVTVIIKGKQNFYAAESPEKLRLVYATFKGEFEDTLPELEEIYRKQQKRPIVKFLEGRKGIQFVLNDLVETLRRGDVYFRYSSLKSALAIQKYIPRSLRARRDEKGLERFMITDGLTEWQKKPNLNRAHKLLPKGSGLFDDNTAHLIYSDKVVFFDFNSETVVLIQNATIAAFQKKIFKILYNLL